MDQDCSNWKTQRKCLKQSLSQESHSPLQGCTATGPNSILGDSNFWESWAMRKTPIGTARWVVTLPPPLCIPLTQYTLYRISNLLHTLQRAPTLQGVHIMTSIVNSADSMLYIVLSLHCTPLAAPALLLYCHMTTLADSYNYNFFFFFLLKLWNLQQVR